MIALLEVGVLVFVLVCGEARVRVWGGRVVTVAVAPGGEHRS